MLAFNLLSLFLLLLLFLLSCTHPLHTASSLSWLWQGLILSPLSGSFALLRRRAEEKTGLLVRALLGL